MNRQDAYPRILHIMCGLLVVGFIANLMVRPVDAKYWLKENTVPEPSLVAAR